MMAKFKIRVISETDRGSLEKKVADFISQNPVDEMMFSTTETKNGVLYSVMLSVLPPDYFLQV